MGVLVTGGAGYIGSIAVERLLDAGEQVIVLDNLSTGYRAAVDDRAEFIEADILDTSCVADTLRRFQVDTVMHFAAFIAVGESCENPTKYFRNNVSGALSVLDAMVAAKTPRFVMSSTAAVYGDPETVPITEDMPLRPKNPYGLSKRMIEQALEWYGASHKLQHVIFRYFNAAGASVVYGEAHQPETHLIPNILMAADGAHERMTVFGHDYDTPDGTCIRDYVHVVDLVDAHILAMRYLRGGGEPRVFNLGSSQGHSVLEVIDAVRRIAGKEPPVVFGPRRAGDADRLVACSDLARRILGWEPARGSLDKIVRDAWEWYKAHPQGYRG